MVDRRGGVCYTGLVFKITDDWGTGFYMGTGQVADRYAKAWLATAEGKGALAAVSADCDALLSMIRQSPDFSAFLRSPLLSVSVQEDAIAKIASKAKFNDVTVAFLRRLARNRRLAALSSILDSARAALDASSGLSRAQVTSASVLDEGKISDIRAQLKKKLGRDVSIETRVDPSLIGGLVVRVGSMMIDDSVKTRLDRMARRLTGQSAA